METAEIKKSFFDRWFFPLIISIIFSAIFVALYMYYKESAIITSGITGNIKVSNIFETYGIYVGLVLWLLSLITIHLLFLIKFLLWLRRFTILNPFIYLVVYGGIFWFGYFLAYFEPRYTDIGRAIIDFFSRPLMYTSLVIIIFSIIWFLFAIIKIILWKKS